MSEDLVVPDKTKSIYDGAIACWRGESMGWFRDHMIKVAPRYGIPIFEPYCNLTQTAIGKRECLSVFGGDYPTPDGTCLRDYIDIVDLAKAHVCAVDRMIDGKMEKEYEIFNIGTGRPLSVLELINSFERVNGVKLNWKMAPRRAGDVVAIWADPSLAEAKLGWKATRSIDQTLSAAWAWEKHLAGIQ